MFIMYITKIIFIQYIRHKNIQMECGKPFYKNVAYLHNVIFISQHFEVLCIISKCDWMNSF